MSPPRFLAKPPASASRIRHASRLRRRALPAPIPLPPARRWRLHLGTALAFDPAPRPAPVPISFTLPAKLPRPSRPGISASQLLAGALPPARPSRATRERQEAGPTPLPPAAPPSRSRNGGVQPTSARRLEESNPPGPTRSPASRDRPCLLQILAPSPGAIAGGRTRGCSPGIFCSRL